MNAQPAVFGRSYFDDSGREYALEAEQIRQMHLRIAD
jgi:hypothetical protein